MRCWVYHVEQATLLSALTDDQLLNKYQQTLAHELPSLADRALVRFLRQQTTLVSRALRDGFDFFAEQDRAAADTLLTDVFAVATWHGWELPIEARGEHDLPVDDLPRGLLGADVATEGAKLWVLDHETIALSRDREADNEPHLEGHPRFGACS